MHVLADNQKVIFRDGSKSPKSSWNLLAFIWIIFGFKNDLSTNKKAMFSWSFILIKLQLKPNLLAYYANVTNDVFVLSSLLQSSIWYFLHNNESCLSYLRVFVAYSWLFYLIITEVCVFQLNNHKFPQLPTRSFCDIWGPNSIFAVIWH